ncbi:helix-turn-helix transcriptional regulator [Croceitalea rosinachiae]|uniref:Helix-turn-helix transcriptional regulator n=1 Tax=Croceitalea rosinachiae TaxID=3075596 RepID=A0ABU3ADB9_9FLAO|nr:helix-turn-helix transcriptional regulator [Croceitalea sp. F388]MDT0608182.1 helix-turn-helix transcriptional regulator [Croceitalea sp. F388]
MGPSKVYTFLLFLLATKIVFGAITTSYTILENKNVNLAYPQDSIRWADYYYNIQRFDKAILLYEKGIERKGVDKSKFLKKLALCEAGLGNAGKSTNYLESYFLLEFNTDFLNHEGFDRIRSSEEFMTILNKYSSKLNFWAFFYLFIAFIGFYTFLILNFNRKIKLPARLLICGFIFIHTYFIFHIGLLISNYQFEYPHSYRMSTCFSFLYGPLLFLYFKKIVHNYSFKKSDLIHLIPTVLILIYLIPTYSLTGSEKLNLMLDRVRNSTEASDSDTLAIIVVLKLFSLIIYGYFIRKMYLKSIKRKKVKKQNRLWQRNLYHIHFLYILSYFIYGILISNNILSGFFFHFQVGSMALMVLYIGYSANIQPNVFNGVVSYANRLFPKYEKSGLTTSLSIELKNHLEQLFKNEKIYKENDISLEMVAQKLNTSRHNASQVINEHFNLSFHELVNKYRIEEAKKMLIDDQRRNLNIIDVAYEVGYNNKVTFNKAFKKDTNLTPSQFQREIPIILQA